jgi:hypothetical protein
VTPTVLVLVLATLAIAVLAITHFVRKKDGTGARKLRLLKGPEQFQNVRVDRPAAKK